MAETVFFVVARRSTRLFVGMAAGFEDVVEADEVGLDVSIGVGDAIADAGLGCEVDYNLRMVFGEDAVDEGAVGDVAADEGEGRGRPSISPLRGGLATAL